MGIPCPCPWLFSAAERSRFSRRRYSGEVGKRTAQLSLLPAARMGVAWLFAGEGLRNASLM